MSIFFTKRNFELRYQFTNYIFGALFAVFFHVNNVNFSTHAVNIYFSHPRFFSQFEYLKLLAATAVAAPL